MYKYFIIFTFFCSSSVFSKDYYIGSIESMKYNTFLRVNDNGKLALSLLNNIDSSQLSAFNFKFYEDDNEIGKNLIHIKYGEKCLAASTTTSSLSLLTCDTETKLIQWEQVPTTSGTAIIINNGNRKCLFSDENLNISVGGCPSDSAIDVTANLLWNIGPEFNALHKTVVSKDEMNLIYTIYSIDDDEDDHEHKHKHK